MIGSMEYLFNSEKLGIFSKKNHTTQIVIIY